MKVTALLVILVLGASSAQEECLPEVSAECPAVDPPVAVHLPDPENCASFCECGTGTAYKLDCEPGLYYNIDVQACDWPVNVDCGDRPLPPQ